MARFQTISDLINRAAVSVGLNAVSDPFASADPAIIQLRTLASECGQDLVSRANWQQLERSQSFTTQLGDTGLYDLPADFSRMLDQTGWQQGAPASAYPLLGPASPAWWSYLQASQVTNVTIYAWVRVAAGQLQLWPQPPPVGVPIAYKYISRYWVLDGTSPPGAPVYKESVTQNSDTPLFEPILFLKKLKLAFLQAKGFDTNKAQDEYIEALDFWSGNDKPSPVLARNQRQMSPRLLDCNTNVSETGYGS
jgi:hypothetical protein